MKMTINELEKSLGLIKKLVDSLEAQIIQFKAQQSLKDEADRFHGSSNKDMAGRNGFTGLPASKRNERPYPHDGVF